MERNKKDGEKKEARESREGQSDEELKKIEGRNDPNHNILFQG